MCKLHHAQRLEKRLPAQGNRRAAHACANVAMALIEALRSVPRRQEAWARSVKYVAGFPA